MDMTYNIMLCIYTVHQETCNSKTFCARFQIFKISEQNNFMVFGIIYLCSIQKYMATFLILYIWWNILFKISDFKQNLKLKFQQDFKEAVDFKGVVEPLQCTQWKHCKSVLCILNQILDVLGWVYYALKLPPVPAFMLFN